MTIASAAGYCDDANTDDTDGCDSTCTVENGWTCSGGDSSTADTCIEDCGDGKNLGGVECDDSNIDDGDGCSSTCTIESGFDCVTSAVLLDICTEICGDGMTIVSVTGFCDDGNVDGSDGCDSTCVVESGWTCSGGDSSTADTCIEDCGDGKNLGGVECDDENIVDGDGCSSTCIKETGFECVTNALLKDTCTEICGDGITINSAAGLCDDGN